ncbi:type II toxin-antitoxin system RelE/ParE family toxin [Azospirillum brasilense]|uniref:type II toxin-antitoxin system RelE/ParE family toxin n=1 Tax=Azospirillum brasilense TaxID=192 RepID=UPI001EDC3767|nr:type II toxin-antitoxin system RelE/ParE family toxin [Azospirillum brasilense]UKJ77077.1 type II toxin-antitoxin system RelE/ParE family toxin [Azospirillum brasilense]
MGGFRLSAPAEADLDAILDWSEERFHAVGRMRYAALLVQAMQELADDPRRDGVEWVRSLKQSVGLYHAWHSRDHGPDPAERVHDPRHAVVFRIAEDGVLDILGFVHDHMLRGRALRRIVRGSQSPRH